MTSQDNTTDEAIKEFLAKGGVIQQIPMGKSGRVEGESYNPWGKKKTATESPLASPPDEDE